jgi:hypothetical protein
VLKSLKGLRWNRASTGDVPGWGILASHNVAEGEGYPANQ